MAVGTKRNRELDGVILKKFSAQYPDPAGNFGNTPANQEIVVFLIGARINQCVHSALHPQIVAISASKGEVKAAKQI